MRLARLALIPAAILLVAACSPGGATPEAQIRCSVVGPVSLGRRDTHRGDSHRRPQDRAGRHDRPGRAPVTFVVTNSGTTDHEFYLGDEAAQAEHEKEMAAMGGWATTSPKASPSSPAKPRNSSTHLRSQVKPSPAATSSATTAVA